MKKILCIASAILLMESAFTQLKIDTANYPIIGRPCPDFVLRNIKYYPKRSAALKDFKNKWLVLDFWNKTCGACIASFPKINTLQNEFGDKIQFILVGIEDREKQIEPMYEKFRRKDTLSLSAAFDSLLAKRWDIYAAPHLIIVDNKGVVRAITAHVDADDISGFLTGSPPNLVNPYKYDWEKDSGISFDEKRPFLINGNGGEDSVFLFRSLLSAYNGNKQKQFVPQYISEDSIHGRFQVLGVPLTVLYNYAYYGMTWPGKDHHAEPVLEVKDSSLFSYSTMKNRNLFCYSLSLPVQKVSGEHMREMMRKDLENYFGYSASIEERPFPCWKLVATPESKKLLHTKGGASSFQSIIPKADFIAQNWPFSDFLRLLRAYNENPIIDETGIKDNIDIQVNGILNDVQEIKKSLMEYGLDLVPGKQVVKVLVIHDKP